MRIAVVGAGTTGTVCGICFAETGHDVKVLEIDAELVSALKQGNLHFVEPGLSSLLKRNLDAGRLHFTTEPKDAIENAQIVFITVGTTQNQDGSSNASIVLESARIIANEMNGPLIVVIKSTVPVGTNSRVAEIFTNEAKHPVNVVSNPEFFKEGTAVKDFMRPDRIIVGSTDEEAKETMAYLYSPYLRTGNPVIFMDPTSAEVTKLTSNAILASRISFMNDIAVLCDQVGADIDKIRLGVGSDARLGKSYLFAGVGYGGRRFPKDVRDLIKIAKGNGVTSEMLEATDRVNDKQRHLIGERVRERFGNDLSAKTFTIWGVANKPGTDDVQEAPSLVIIRDLLNAGASVRIYDPAAIENIQEILGDKVKYFRNGYEACKGSDALIIVTEWSQFRKPDFNHLKSLLSSPVIFDGRNIYNHKHLATQGFDYIGIGRGTKKNNNT